jgi:hypothetical protein
MRQCSLNFRVAMTVARALVLLSLLQIGKLTLTIETNQGPYEILSSSGKSCILTYTCTVHCI